MPNETRRIMVEYTVGVEGQACSDMTSMRIDNEEDEASNQEDVKAGLHLSKKNIIESKEKRHRNFVLLP